MLLTDIVLPGTSPRSMITVAGGYSAAEISASKVDGTLYIQKNGSADLYKWNPMNKSFDKINNLTVDTFAVDGDGRPWICRDTTPVIERAKD